MNVVWTEGAAQDLTEIIDYIADDSPEAARRVAKHIFDSLTRGGDALYGAEACGGQFA
jgi:plasmid stabilization system protein ParE